MSFVVDTTARASDNDSAAYVKSKKGTVHLGKYHVEKDGQIVIYTTTTNSRIPERVVLKGQQVNSSSPLYVVQGDELLRTGATSIVGILSLDPSISSRRP
jgi:hypothetical protein